MEVMEKIRNPYLATIKKEKREFYPQFGDQILEFSIFDVSRMENKFFIGVKIFESKNDLLVVNIKDINLSYSQRATIINAFMAKEIGIKNSDFE